MLKISNLEVEVNGKKILKAVSLNVAPGELHVLMGPNGAGKTSLGLALMGKEGYKVNHGQIILDDLDITKLSTDQRAKRGLFLSFQKPVEIPGVSVKNLLDLLIEDDLEEKISKVSSELNLNEDLLNRSLNENFSGGETKKIELFQAKILSPKYIILDEVDSGLDIDSLSLASQNIKDLLNGKNKPGIILITHNTRILKFLKPNSLHVMVNGEIKKSGGTELMNLVEKRGFSWLTKN